MVKVTDPVDSERKQLKTERIERQDTISEFDGDREFYQKEFAGYEPTFKGKEPGYVPCSFFETVYIVASLLPVYIICSGALVGQVYLAINWGKWFSWVCLALLVGYITICTLVVFWGSFGRRALTREALEIRRKEQVAELEKAKTLREKADRKLKEAQAKAKQDEEQEKL